MQDISNKRLEFRTGAEKSYVGAIGTEEENDNISNKSFLRL
jgi:hypothetical protein